ncbi:PH domain-containing protein [Candidatus Daviesbacteria bacterium]|nr:PH domain-containing protein [Candidatus Daviesbacteria bacterium]
MHFRFFPATIIKPENIKFENQEADEHIELFMREHWITNVPWVTISILAFILPLILVQVTSFVGLQFVFNAPLQLILGGLIIYYLLIIAYIIESFLFWYFNVEIVTNKHLIDVMFHSLLSRQIVEIGLEDIENISRSAGGIIDSLFNFGDVLIQTAANEQNIEFSNVSNPDFVVDKIQDLIEARKLFFEEGT